MGLDSNLICREASIMKQNPKSLREGCTSCWTSSLLELCSSSVVFVGNRRRCDELIGNYFSTVSTSSLICALKFNKAILFSLNTSHWLTHNSLYNSLYLMMIKLRSAKIIIGWYSLVEERRLLRSGTENRGFYVANRVVQRHDVSILHSVIRTSSHNIITKDTSCYDNWVSCPGLWTGHEAK